MTSSLAISVSDDGLALVPEHDQAASLVPADAACAPQRQFWETEHTRPDFQPSNEAAPELVAATANYLGECMRHPYLPVSEIRARQFARIKELVELA